MYDNILIPTDGSQTVEQTLEHALPIATDNDATVHALSVVDTRIIQAACGDTREEMTAQLERESESAAAAVADRATAVGLDATEAVEHGTPAKTILEYTDERGVDLIIIGTHGKSPREKRMSMGSVSERVVDKSSVPVFVVQSANSPSP